MILDIIAIIAKVLFGLIGAGLIVGLAGTIICFGIDAITDIDAYHAATIFLTIALISFALYALLVIVAFIFGCFGI